LLDSILGDRQFLLGQHLSLADIPIGTTLYRYFNIDIARPRPAYRSHVMVPFEELRGRVAY